MTGVHVHPLLKRRFDISNTRIVKNGDDLFSKTLLTVVYGISHPAATVI